MAIGWFICGYEINPIRRNLRYCAMKQHDSIINADNGAWAESEVLGGSAVVKVRATEATLTTIANTTGFQRIPSGFVNLTDGLTTLTNAQRSVLTARILQMGYTQAELDAVMGTTLAAWRLRTLGDLLRFIASKHLLPRWDDVQQQIVLDGDLVACTPISTIDSAVSI